MQQSAAHAAEQLPPGLKGPRVDVLLELKRSGQLPAKDLARRLGLSLTAVRHHLKELEAAGLISYARQHRAGVGAPGFVYSLTSAGEALFPQRYKETLTQLLDSVVAVEGREAAVRFLEAHFEQLAARLEPELEGATPVERMAIVTRARSEDGYMAEGAATFCCGTLTEHHCAIRAVSERFPEICTAEQRFLERTLGGRVERRLHLLQGDGACSYAVRFPRNGEQDATVEESE